MNSQTTKANSDNEVAIRTLYQQMIDGWNGGNGDAFATPFTDDSDFIGFDGTHMKGRQEIASFHQLLFDRFVKGSRLVGKVRGVRFLRSDIAITIAVGGTVMAGGSGLIAWAGWNLGPAIESLPASCFGALTIALAALLYARFHGLQFGAALPVEAVVA